LPSLVDEIESKRDACHDKLVKLGRPRLTPYDQQLFLLGISESFQRLVKSATDGDWNDLFFKETESDNGYHRRLRAVIQNSNDNFAKTLTRNGQLRHIGDSSIAPPQNAIHTTRDEFLEHVEAKMRMSRGRELPGLFDPMIIANLFRDQASPWERLVRDHVDSTWKACKVFLQHLIVHITDPGTSTALLQKIIGPAMENISMALKAKTDDVLKTHQAIHPITYNHHYTETVQKIRADRKRNECASAVKRFFNVSTLGPCDLFITNVDLSSLVDTIIGDTTEPDMNRFAASDVSDHMEAYYKVAMKRFIDNVAVEVIEVGLVSALIDILSPVKVHMMKAELVAHIAGESEENQTYREQLNRQLEVLGKGAEICKQFAFVKIRADSVPVTDEVSNNHRNRMIHNKGIGPHFENPASQISETVAYEENTGEESFPLDETVPESSVCDSEPKTAEMSDPWVSFSVLKEKKKKKKGKKHKADEELV
ncbi:hypothetical protein J7T55_002027, partial [Diaporthe amygdali]|uniref:uncharacterized protein n=1 Tax=Phomopsis amygdali TaxID=1214568 RepID=UPI0022FEDE5C